MGSIRLTCLLDSQKNLLKYHSAQIAQPNSSVAEEDLFKTLMGRPINFCRKDHRSKKIND
jgi:hypothetical protein